MGNALLGDQGEHCMLEWPATCIGAGTGTCCLSPVLGRGPTTGTGSECQSPAYDYFAAAATAAVRASVPSSDLPPTVSPAADSLWAALSLTPLTRFSKSAQSLKGPPLVRSSMMSLAVLAPMPLTLSRAAASALLTSTSARAEPIEAAIAAASNQCLIM